MCVSYEHIHTNAGALGGQKKVPGPLEPELLAVVRHLIQAGPEFRSSTSIVGALSH